MNVCNFFFDHILLPSLYSSFTPLTHTRIDLPTPLNVHHTYLPHPPTHSYTLFAIAIPCLPSRMIFYFPLLYLSHHPSHSITTLYSPTLLLPPSTYPLYSYTLYTTAISCLSPRKLVYENRKKLFVYFAGTF